MEQVAERVLDAIRSTVHTEHLHGVSYYDEDGVGHVYRSDWADEKYSPDQVDAIVEDLRLGALGHGAHEQLQEEELHATVRIYDEMLDVAVPVTEQRGVAVAIDKDADYSVRDLVSIAEDVVESANGDA